MEKNSGLTEAKRKAIKTWHWPDYLPEDVTRWAILRYVASTEDPNPLYNDEEYAKKSRWGGIIAPPTFIDAYSSHNHQWRELPGDQLPQVMPFPLPYERTFLGSEEFEIFQPVRPGDSILCKGIIGDLSERQSKTGKLVFTRNDFEYYNQRNELVTRQKYTFVSVEISGSGPVSSLPDVPQKPIKPATIMQKQVCFEDVKIGDMLPSMDKKVTFLKLLKFGGATGTMGLPHFDYKYMTQVMGMPNVIGHGELNCAYLAQLVTNWIGGWGIIVKHFNENRGNVFEGDTLSIGGRVTAKYTQQSENFVECETWGENQYGQKVILGKSTVTLPLKGQMG